ncbi:MAG: hypothetical protein K9J37_18225 [Saprospiraceae bacterium]|nr:hypothetical protein [Saprospiraceae bacterium]MCF8251857.1 hypothetical protein [Saprospiraceae bacterium]MCF8313534.1 hypothetical protein [Saprospiraceae bacterium]MCF8442605.1 hypothetical protein [Saprospiraceae bacterium]
MAIFSGGSERTEQLRQVAFKLNMEFNEQDEYGMIGLLRDFQLFGKGGRKEISNLMTQSSQLMEDRFHVFDYKYTISTGKSAHTFRQTVLFINSKRLSMPEMLMKPEHFFNKIGTWLGLQQDIDFEEHKVFSDNYLLQGEDEARVRRTMDQEEIIRFFTIEKDWYLESVGFFMIFYQRNRLIEPNEIKHLHERGVLLFEYFKKEPL